VSSELSVLFSETKVFLGKKEASKRVAFGLLTEAMCRTDFD